MKLVRLQKKIDNLLLSRGCDRTIFLPRFEYSHCDGGQNFVKFSHSEKARFWTLLLGAGITPNNQSLVPRWGLLLGILDGGGVFCSVLQIMTQFFRPNNGILTPVFRPGLKEIKSSLLRLKCQIKRCLANLFLSYSFGIETRNTFIHSSRQFPQKPYPTPGQNEQSVYPSSNRKGEHTSYLASM